MAWTDALPDFRLPYHKDGSLVRVWQDTERTNASTGATQTEKDAWQDEDSATGVSYGSSGRYDWRCLFPFAVDLLGFFFAASNDPLGLYMPVPELHVSTDTTNLQDGTWTNVTSGITYPAGSNNRIVESAVGVASYSTLIRTLNQAGIKGVRCYYEPRWGGAQYLTTAHLYGKPTVLGGQRLMIWHPTLDQRAVPADLNLGNVAQGTTATKDFRVKNMDTVKTASGVVISASSLSGSKSAHADYTFSIGGGAASASLNIGNLLPGAMSGVITAHRTVPSGDAIGDAMVHLQAAPTSWS